MDRAGLKLAIEKNCSPVVDKTTLAINQTSIDHHSDLMRTLYAYVIELSDQVAVMATTINALEAAKAGQTKQIGEQKQELEALKSGHAKSWSGLFSASNHKTTSAEAAILHTVTVELNDQKRREKIIVLSGIKESTKTSGDENG